MEENCELCLCYYCTDVDCAAKECQRCRGKELTECEDYSPDENTFLDEEE